MCAPIQNVKFTPILDANKNMLAEVVKNYINNKYKKIDIKNNIITIQLSSMK